VVRIVGGEESHGKSLLVPTKTCQKIVRDVRIRGYELFVARGVALKRAVMVK